MGCPRYVGHFLLSSPLVFFGYCARAWGELTGLLAPARTAGSNPLTAPVR